MFAGSGQRTKSSIPEALGSEWLRAYYEQEGEQLRWIYRGENHSSLRKYLAM